jgi:anoctamin-10
VGRSVRLSTRVEKEYLKPSYTASIGAELEDGLFDGKYVLFGSFNSHSGCSSYITPVLSICSLKANDGVCAYIIESTTDFLELALQFGMIMMFACAFPLIFCFAALVWISITKSLMHYVV